MPAPASINSAVEMNAALRDLLINGQMYRDAFLSVIALLRFLFRYTGRKRPTQIEAAGAH